MKAIHLICEHVGISWKYLTRQGDGKYRSGFWDLTKQEASDLVGGWIYLHETKQNPSGFGGQILGFQIERYEAVHEDRIVFEVEARSEGRNQKWRGQSHAMAWTGKIVDADYSHERERNNANRP